jgi:hypothetical protein
MAEQLELFPNEQVESPAKVKIQDPEWCFQFFDNEPIVIGWQQNPEAESSPLVMQIEAFEGEGMVFQQNGMQFKLFARPISEQSKKEREEELKNK